MTNKEIAAHFRDLARVMEYAGENAFKIRSYSKAYDLLRKRDEPVAHLSAPELQQLDGIGKAISEKIVALVHTGRLEQLDRYRATLPPAAAELLQVRGLGPKKVKQLVEELEIESVGELLHAIRENRVIELKGYSDKSQAKLRQQLEFYQSSQGLARYADLEARALKFLKALRQNCTRAELTGELRRQLPVVTEITLLATRDALPYLREAGFSESEQSAIGELDEFATRVLLTDPEDFARAWVHSSSAPAFLAEHTALREADGANEAAVFADADLPYVPAPQREAESPFPPVVAADVIGERDVRGVVHAHTTWSDGATSSEVLAKACRDAGYDYLVVTDHSKAAGYAGGLSRERLLAQRDELRALDARLPDFRVFAGTECDILRDGTLDYDADTLRTLDVVIASVHSVLTMSLEDATARIVRAIETGLVDILGHPTGRLLLSRAGYPLDWDRVFDACASHGTAVELNASPYRLDVDWTLIPRALERGLKISINPDAHALSGLGDIRYGVLAAQKAGLRPAECLNALDADGFAAWLAARGQA